MHDDTEQVRLDAGLLKAVAHPLRARLLAALRLDGPATASQLATRFATNSGQTSYHLRYLQNAGLVEEVTDQGTARERYWRARHRSSVVDPGDFVADPAASERWRWLQSHAAVAQDRNFQRWLDSQEDYSDEWRAAADMSDWVLRLTPDQLRALTAEVGAVLRRYSEQESEVPDAERVAVTLRAYPFRDVDLS